MLFYPFGIGRLSVIGQAKPRFFHYRTQLLSRSTRKREEALSQKGEARGSQPRYRLGLESTRIVAPEPLA